MKLNFNKLLNNKNVLKVLSLLLAIIAWLVVVKAIDPTAEKTISGVTFDAAANQAETLGPNNLNVVESDITEVDVRISGEAIVVGGVKPEDIEITADLSKITEPGKKTVPLIGTAQNDKKFEIISIKPDKVKLRIDRLVSKKFTIEAQVDGMKTPDDYIRSLPSVNPKEVTITGPDADIQKISKCVVSATVTDPLTRNTTLTNSIVLYDSDGNILQDDLLIMDVQTADITIPVNKKKSLPVKFEYLNVPRGFVAENLDYKLSVGAIDVAGPEELIDKYQVLDLGYVSINEIKPDKVFVFPVELPTGFVNLSDVTKVSLQFNLADTTSAMFTIPGKNIALINEPVNLQVTVTTPSISGVHIIGDPTVLETLSSQDLVAEIDLSEQELTPGPVNLPVHISAPNKGFVWAVGDYTAVVTIKEKTE